MKYRWFFAIFLLAGALVAALINPWLALAVVLGGLAIVLLARNLGFGLIVLVFFFPYLGLVIDFSQFEALRETLYLKNINAPFVDLYGLLLLAAWAIAAALPSTGSPSAWQRISMPHWKSYGLFWRSGLVSLLKVPSIYFYSSLKYFARPFTFPYLVFFAMPISIMSNVKGQMSKVLTVFYWTGLISAFDGLLGLLFGAHADFPRAMPFGFFGVNPLGPNHNLLAETLIATAPAGLFLSRTTLSDVQAAAQHLVLHKKWIMWGMFFQWIIALLTFARTAWIAVFVQAILYVYFAHRGRVGKFIKDYAPIIILLAAMAVILGVTTFTETVRGSTLTRLDMARIAAFYFERTPWTGQGIGTFIPTLWQTKSYLLEYGEPLEAHGIIFKLMFEQGLFGLIAFGVLAGAILRRIYKTYRDNQSNRSYLIAALMIAAGSLAYQLFNTTYYTSKLWVPLAIAVAITKLYEHSNSHTKMVS